MPGDENAASAAVNAAANELASAEEKIAKKDFEGARAVLGPTLRSIPGHEARLFHLGDVEDAEATMPTRLRQRDRRAIEANPKQFEAQLAMMLLRQRRQDSEKALPFIQAATLLAPVPPNPDSKARAWRALAQLADFGPYAGEICSARSTENQQGDHRRHAVDGGDCGRQRR